ncbi:MAG TPA: CARDB domain-containing protein [Pyrinomonadaceae bacterium]|nr:CARDB domain-containing protein [Pyrinomonadaceae bacterium]
MHTVKIFTAKIFLVSFTVLFFSAFVFPQNEADLEIKTETAAKIVRGGEKFTVNVTVTNTGKKTAQDVYMALRIQGSEIISSAVPNGGECKFSDYQRHLVCEVSKIEAGETYLTVVEIQVAEFGDVSELNPELAEKLPKMSASAQLALSGFQKRLGKDDQSREIDLHFYSNTSSIENDRENNDTRLSIKAFPSKNIPPRLELVSPKIDAVFIKQIDKPLEIVVTLKAYDPDGSIEKVIVNDPEYSPFYNSKMVVEDNQYKLSYQGKIFTGKEFEEYLIANPPIERLAEKTGKDTYTYTLKKLRYTENQIFVSTVDNGGRTDQIQIKFTVNGDAETKFTSPKNGQVFLPNSTIKIETSSTINDPLLKELRLLGSVNADAGLWSDLPLLRQTSKNGNLFTNQYVWKNVPEGIYNLRTVMINDSMPTNYSEDITIAVAKPRVIKITSLKNGQNLEANKPFMLTVEALDIDGNLTNDKLRLYIDGKYSGDIYNSWSYSDELPNHKVLNKDTGKTISLEKGSHTVKIVAVDEYRDYIIFGESETVTFNVK